MSYADEELSFSVEEIARSRRYASDISELSKLYEDLLIQSKKDAAELVSLRERSANLQRDSKKMSAQLQSASAEILSLKALLTKLRKSRQLRVGKAILLPAQRVRRVMRRLEQPKHESVSSALSEAPVKPNTPAAASERPATRENMRAEYLRLSALARSEGASAATMQAISYAYYVLGDIREPAKMINESDSLNGLGGREQATVAAITGLDRLMDSLPILTPRQPNPAYTPERGRIMYCAHSTGHFNSNGYSTRTAELTHGLQSQGLDVMVAARPGYPWDVAIDQAKPPEARLKMSVLGVNHVFNPGPSWTKQPLDQYWLEATDVYVREAQRARVSAVHSASNYVTALPALAAARRLGIPFSYEVRGLWEVTEASAKPMWEEAERYQLAVKMETYVATNADIVFAITEQVREELIRRGVEPKRISILPNGVDTNRFTPMPPSVDLRNKLHLSQEMPVIGYAGSLVHYEGLNDLLEALKLLKEDSVDFHAVIVGDGPELGNLQRETSTLGLGENVTFTGRVEASEVPKYVSLFDVMPCPRRSLPVTELVSPLKPLEAMAAAKAMVLTNLAPLRVFAGADQERALLATPSDPNSLAAALKTLLKNPKLRKEIGSRARLWTVQERQWKLIGRVAAGELMGAIEQGVVASPSGRQMKNITIGIVADHFTTESFRPEARLCELLPQNWRQQVQETPLDVLFIESAWEGLGGQWKQKIGYYDDERFRDLMDLVEFCNRESIPTIFWNKEDPVHFNRFKPSAVLFDHIFTTDANCVGQYAEAKSPRTKTIASLPFFAQPRLHNPIPSDYDYEHTVSYAGSFYGERYAKRSAELTSLLIAGKKHGLTIYDRQYSNSSSNYKFPTSLQCFVRGGLPYLEMVKAYKGHPVHINVNSVEGSPTMFSRRVAELAASGTAILSGRGKGVDETMAGLVPTVSGTEEAAVLLDRWMKNEMVRIDDAWLAYRLIHRSHTAGQRLAYVLRCAGLVVRAPELPKYAIKVDSPSPQSLKALERQSARPAAVIYRDLLPDTDTTLRLIHENEADVELLNRLGVAWVGVYPSAHPDRTLYEDLLTGSTFGDWEEISLSQADLDITGLGLAQIGRPSSGSVSLRRFTPSENGSKPSLIFRRSWREDMTGVQKISSDLLETPKRVLVAGHDLKFANEIIAGLEARGNTVSVDLWQGHNQHDEEKSKRLLKEADVVFCEWTLGNAAWYARNLQPGQRLVSRVHSQEIFTPYLKRLDVSRIERIVFVGQHIADIAIRDHGIPANKSIVIPNPINVAGLSLEKQDDARFNLGMVGIVPAQKHLDRALDVLAGLRVTDKRYQLFIKGKRPEDYSWMARRPEEMAFYEQQYLRIATDPSLMGAVHFDAHGSDMPQWYRKIGVVLSVSDFESFHLTLADGAASGAVPASLGWPGSDQIYPASWIRASINELVEYIANSTSAIEDWRNMGIAARTFVAQEFADKEIVSEIVQVILGSDNTASQVSC